MSSSFVAVVWLILNLILVVVNAGSGGCSRVVDLQDRRELVLLNPVDWEVVSLEWGGLVGLSLGARYILLDPCLIKFGV